MNKVISSSHSFENSGWPTYLLLWKYIQQYWCGAAMFRPWIVSWMMILMCICIMCIGGNNVLCVHWIMSWLIESCNRKLFYDHYPQIIHWKVLCEFFNVQQWLNLVKWQEFLFEVNKDANSICKWVKILWSSHTPAMFPNNTIREYNI